MRDGTHKAEDDLSALWQGLETSIDPFYKIERRRELDGGAVDREGLRRYKRSLSVIRPEDDEIFGVAGIERAQNWSHHILVINLRL